MSLGLVAKSAPAFARSSYLRCSIKPSIARVEFGPVAMETAIGNHGALRVIEGGVTGARGHVRVGVIQAHDHQCILNSL